MKTRNNIKYLVSIQENVVLSCWIYSPESDCLLSIWFRNSFEKVELLYLWQFICILEKSMDRKKSVTAKWKPLKGFTVPTRSLHRERRPQARGQRDSIEIVKCAIFRTNCVNLNVMGHYILTLRECSPNFQIASYLYTRSTRV